MNGSPHQSLPGLPGPGDVIAGKYRIDAVIGTGGMGVVLGAEDTSLGRRVAIKMLAPSKAGKEGAGARFLREARAAASIQSENVVRVFEVATLPDGASYIVMEQLVGSDLSQALSARGPFPIDEAVDDLLQACEAIGEAHGRGIVHRDLKPQNLFETRRPDGSTLVKVLDFGISKALDEQAPNLTSTDVVMGTPLYMSPEQVRSLKNVDHRTDIWSLGAILFELLTAAPVFDATTASALCAAIAMDPPVPLRARRFEAPAELEAIILRCLHKDPAGRYQDVGELAQALAPFASERGRSAAEDVVRIVRGLGGAAVQAGPQVSAYAPTTEIPSGAPQTTPPVHTPPMLQATTPVTQQTWNRTSGDAAPPKRSALPLILGVVGLGLVAIVAALGVGMYMFFGSHRTVASAPMPVVIASDVPSAGILIPPIVSPSASATVAPAPSASGSVPVPVPVAKKDAGVSPNTSAQDLEAQKRLAAGQCQHMKFILQMNDAGTNNGASEVKLITCLHASGPQGVSCERQVCRQACATLGDTQCLQMLDNADRNFPPKF